MMLLDTGSEVVQCNLQCTLQPSISQEQSFGYPSVPGYSMLSNEYEAPTPSRYKLVDMPLG